MPIEIDGVARRSFKFPAPLDTTFAYYSDLDSIFTSLPYISVLEKFSKVGFRLLYNALELGIYSIRIVCDIEVSLDAQNHLLSIIPLKGTKQVKSTFAVRSAQAQGIYSSESRFISYGDYTQVEYSLRIQASLPTPFATLYIPPSMRNNIASRITSRRIGEIADGFIERSIRRFHQA